MDITLILLITFGSITMFIILTVYDKAVGVNVFKKSKPSATEDKKF